MVHGIQAVALTAPYGFVWLNILVTLFIGVAFGYLSSTITAAVSPTPADE